MKTCPTCFRARWITAPLLSILLAASSCSEEPRPIERPMVLHSPRSCPASQDAYAVVYASGDFEPSSERPPSASLFLREIGRTMESLPAQTRSLLVDVSQGDASFFGVGDVPSSGPTHILVWPRSKTCSLTGDVERRTEMTLGAIGHQVVVAGGRARDSSLVPHTLVGDLATGIVERLAFGLGARRIRPTVTPFPLASNGPSPALVAGGADPDSGAALATAEIYLPKVGAPGDIGDFADQRITLSEARSEHGAVVLSTGETLLVGGRGANGPLRTMEIVDPTTRRARTGGIALLAVAREHPTVLRLANGEILVAGGTDAQGLEIATLEWFAPDASHPTKRTVDLVTGTRRAFVPLEAGGALAVVLPDDGSADFKTVWVISAAGTLEPAHSMAAPTLDIVRLFPGAEGAPILWTGKRWMRWQPWVGEFAPIDPAPDRGPTLDAIASGDSGLAVWLDESTEAMTISGFRFAARTRFDALPNPLLVSGTEQLAPDRLAGSPGSAIHFEPSRGLVLGPGASAFLTDVTFADFELEVDVTAAAPTIVLREEGGAELEVGGAACAFVEAATQRIVVKRRARRVRVSIDGNTERECPLELTPNTRVALGIRGSQVADVSGAKNLRVARR